MHLDNQQTQILQTLASTRPEDTVLRLNTIFSESRQSHQAEINRNPKLKARVDLLEMILPVIPQAAAELGRLLRAAFSDSEFSLGKIRIYLVGSRARESAPFNLTTDFDLIITVEGRLPWQESHVDPRTELPRRRFFGWAHDRLKQMKINNAGKRAVINEENFQKLRDHSSFSASADRPALLVYEES